MDTSIVQIEEPRNTLTEAIQGAFKTKEGTETKKSDSHRWYDQSKYTLHQIYGTYTWFVDLVKFGDYWYVFFVEANSRYLIVIQGNSNFITEDSVQIQLKQRVSSQTFREVFIQFMKMCDNKINLLIGDSEKAFWSNDMMKYYEDLNIKTKIMNVSSEGHIGMSILDRLVRTMRDICYRLKLPESVMPKDMIYATIAYNNTIHGAFHKYLGLDVTPSQVHENMEIQDMFVEELRNLNIQTACSTGYNIWVDTEVVVKKEKLKKFEKIRENIMPGIWVVEAKTTRGYTVKNKSSGEVLENVPRSRLRPIYPRSSYPQRGSFYPQRGSSSLPDNVSYIPA